jgi:hypothetical protein
VAYLRLFARRFVDRVRRHRPDLVRRPFIGTASWIASLLEERSVAPDG